MGYSGKTRPWDKTSKPLLCFVVTEDWYFASHRFQLGQAALQAGFDVVVVTRCREKASAIQEAKKNAWAMLAEPKLEKHFP